MDGTADADRVAASLAARLATLTFVDRSTEEVTALLIDTVADWAAAQGWRVYRRAASVLPLPPPYAHLRSVLDVACARPQGPPVVVEVDRADRQRSVEKLRAEIEAGRIGIWLRWGSRGFTPPPPPVRMVTCTVTTRRGGAGTGSLHSRLPEVRRPAPRHTLTTGAVVEAQAELFGGGAPTPGDERPGDGTPSGGERGGEEPGDGKTGDDQPGGETPRGAGGPGGE
ncbi:hypothetical protein AB0J86_07675 [Micromonospora sp. NPDC049559]|uniref:hypothetical protein n=1 Tax=Micromonospora sp. NPDC049559 TaxID=3155923 RepID=UPI0034163278